MGPGAKPRIGGTSIEDTRRAGMKGTAVMTMAIAGGTTKGTVTTTSTDHVSPIPSPPPILLHLSFGPQEPLA